MTIPPSRRTVTIHAAALLLAGSALALGGCSSDPAATTSEPVPVTATDTECTLGSSELAAGTTTLAVTNTGTQVTEVYVYAGEQIVAEVENIGPGTSQDLVVELTPGSYEIACKPGMTGDGIRTTVTVTDNATSADGY